MDIKFSLTDNGDDKVYLEVFLSNDKKIVNVCSLYTPQLEPSRLMIGGLGHSVYIKELSLRQVNRKDEVKSGFVSHSQEREDCCCNIF